MMFLDCPAYLDEGGAQRCGLPAEVMARVTMGSTGGPIESVKICCPSGHRFNAPIEFLAMPAAHHDKRQEALDAPVVTGGVAGAVPGRSLPAHLEQPGGPVPVPGVGGEQLAHACVVDLLPDQRPAHD